jgi:hypothetical protein
MGVGRRFQVSRFSFHAYRVSRGMVYSFTAGASPIDTGYGEQRDITDEKRDT